MHVGHKLHSPSANGIEGLPSREVSLLNCVTLGRLAYSHRPAINSPMLFRRGSSKFNVGRSSRKPIGPTLQSDATSPRQPCMSAEYQSDTRVAIGQRDTVLRRTTTRAVSDGRRRRSRHTFRRRVASAMQSHVVAAVYGVLNLPENQCSSLQQPCTPHVLYYPASEIYTAVYSIINRRRPPPSAAPGPCHDRVRGLEVAARRLIDGNRGPL